MKKYILFFAFSLLVTGLTSCDDGRIYENTGFVPREGRVLKLSGKFSGINKWSEGYSIVVAGFDDESEYAIVSKVIPTPETDGGEVEVILSGISEDRDRTMCHQQTAKTCRQFPDHRRFHGNCRHYLHGSRHD